MKISNTAKNVLLMIIALAVLIIPPGVISYAEYSVTQNIISVQASYTDGDNLEIAPANETIIVSNFTIQSVIDKEINYDGAIFGEKTSTITRRYAYFDDMITYIGNDTYSVSPNYAAVNETTYNRGRMIIIPLDISVSELASYDFYRVTTTFGNVTPTIMTGYAVPFAPAQRMTDTEYIFINTLSMKSYMESHDGEPVYLVFGSQYVDILEDDITTWKFNVECFNLTDTDALTWTDSQIYMMTILGCDIILIFGFIFTTNFIDVKIDRSKPRKNGRKKYKW